MTPSHGCPAEGEGSPLAAHPPASSLRARYAVVQTVERSVLKPSCARPPGSACGISAKQTWTQCPNGDDVLNTFRTGKSDAMITPSPVRDRVITTYIQARSNRANAFPARPCVQVPDAAPITGPAPGGRPVGGAPRNGRWRHLRTGRADRSRRPVRRASPDRH